MGDVLRGAYYALEDKYYAVLDRIQKAVPVYSVVDPIDKIIPSFVLLIIIVLLAVGALATVMLQLPLIPGNTSAISFTVLDSGSSPLQGAAIKLGYDGKTLSATTDSSGTASIGVPLNKEVNFAVSLQGYNTYSDSFTASVQAIPKKIVLEQSKKGSAVKTINLLDSVGQPLLEPVSLNFVCTNAQAIAPESIISGSGSASVEMPEDCGTLKATAKAAGYDDQQATLRSATNSIYMKESTASFASSGTVIVNVTSATGTKLDGITVSAFNDQQMEAVDTKATASGQAKFELDAGNYYFLAQANRQFGERKSDAVQLQANQTKSVSLVLEESVKGNVMVKVIDKDTGIPVNAARVTLKLGDSTIAGPIDTNRDLNSIVSFPVTTDASYTIVVDQPDYLIKKISDAKYGNTLYEARLEKYVAGVNGGILKISVVDQDSKPVQNARVALFDAQSMQNTGLSEQTTDINGSAKFSRVSNGDYYAFAYKGSSSGKSDPLPHFDSRISDVTLTVVMAIPNAQLKVNVKDFGGNPFPFALVTVYDYLNDSKAAFDYTDANGTFSVQLKSDKRVYAVVNDPKGNHFDYVTSEKELVPNTETDFDVQLLRPSSETKIEFVGLYKDNKFVSQNVEAGQEYEAKFLLTVPAAADSALVHIRTGDKSLVENDSWFIKSAGIPKARLLAGSSYSPNAPDGYNRDAASDTANGMKWFNASWNSVKAGNYEVEANLKVNDTSLLGEQLNLEYRAWAQINGTKKMVPEQITPVSNELYSNTKRETFSVGPSTLCKNDFCFDATVLDLKQNISASVSDSYGARISQDYRLTFTLTNESKNVHNSAEIRVENGENGIVFKSYSINTASGQKWDNQNWGKSYIGYDSEGLSPKIDLGNFGPKNKVQGTVTFTPRLAITSPITIRVISDYKVVFEKEIMVTTAAAKNFDITFTPRVLPSGIESGLTFQVKDSSQQPAIEVQNVWVKLMDHRKANAIVAVGQTNADGNIQFIVPSQLPGEKLFAEFSKADFSQAVIEIPVESSVLKFSPETLAATLNAQTKKQSSDSFSVQNKTSFELTITAISLTGNSKGYIDLVKTNNILKSLVGVKVQPDSPLQLNENNFLTDAGAALTDAQSLELNTLITVSAKGQSWQFSLPTSVSIGVGKEVESSDCLALNLSKWETSTEGNPVQAEFTVQNNCVVDGQPIELQGLEAKLETSGNLLGTYALSVKDSELLNSLELRQGYYKKVLNKMEKEKSYTVNLLFTPNGGINGTDKTSVAFRAINPVTGAKQYLTGKVEASIAIVNLKDCVSFSKDTLQLNDAKGETFTVSTKGCAGNVAVKFDSELELSKNDFTLQATETSSEISVTSRNPVPGAYFVDAKVKGAGRTDYKPVKTILVRVFPPEGSCIDLDKFEFDVYNNPKAPNSGFDTVTMKNSCYERRQAVTFETPKLTLGNFFTASGFKKALGYAVLGFLITMPSYAAKNIKENKSIFSGLDFWTPLWESIFPSSNSGTSGSKNLSEGSIETTPSTTPATGGSFAESRLPGTRVTAYAGLGFKDFMNFIPALLKEALSMNPWVAAGIGLITGFVTNWFSQEPVTLDVVVADVGADNYSLIMPKAAADTPVLDVNLSETGETSKNVMQNGLEDYSKDFVLQSVPSTPTGKFSRILKVSGSKFVYGKTYSNDYLEKAAIAAANLITHKELPAKGDAPDNEFSQKFHLVFRNTNPLEDANVFIPPYALNCQLGTKAGLTGANALPRIGLAQGKDWTWNDTTGIAFNSCDEGSADYVYCDSSQFSIELMKKLELVNRFLERNPNLNCPDLSQLVGNSVSTTLEANDLGITKLSVQTLGSDLNVIVEASNTNLGTVSGTIKVALKNLDTNAIVLPAASQAGLSLTSNQKASLGFIVTAPPNGNYRVDANLINASLPCAGCLNDPSTDYLATAVAVGGQGIQQCSPKTTDPSSQFSLSDFISATEKTRTLTYFPEKGINSNAEFQSKLISFKSYLVKDGYSPEFQRDFDDYAMTKDFFGASSDYKTKFHNYFKDTANFSFVPRYQLVPGTTLQLSEPGLYQVDLNITFGADWQMFDSSNNNAPKAKIIVSMERVASPSQPNPWYYLPFDGLVGSENGRIGYGLNYSGDPIQLVTGNAGLRTIEIKGSNSGNLETSTYNDFKSLNVDNRGVVLSVQNSDAGQSMAFSPSNATPVIMRVTNSGGKEAWGFYSVGVDNNSAANVGQTMNYWYGIGLNCRDFEETPVTETFQWTPDVHGTSAKCARLGGIDNSAYSYGFEWCDSTRTGNVYLKSVFFTPQGKESVISKTGANESMAFMLANGLQAERVPLTGSIAGQINSVKDVFAQVKSNNVCVSGTGAKQEFWWNPKTVLDGISVQEQGLETKCIQAS